jgi:Arylsulfotransferase (ASST)
MPAFMIRRWVLLGVIAALAIGLFVLLNRDDPAPVALPVKPTATAVPDQTFRSRPDLAPPTLTVSGKASGYVFLAPKRTPGQIGPMILNRDGEIVWFHPLSNGMTADDFGVQTYRGKPVLTWWEGKLKPNGYGEGTWVIADRSYQEIARVRAGRGLQGDLHEIQLTDRGTALVSIYHHVKRDLTELGSVADADVLDSAIQEIDVKTGKVLWQWSAVKHVGIGETYVNIPKTAGKLMDFFHINSIDELPNGNLLVSARNTWAIYEISKKTGEIVWRLGGRRSDFAMGEGTRFAWQHDARAHRDGTITLFDNESDPKIGDQTRLLTLDVDEAARRVTVARALTHPRKLLAGVEGNAQLLDDGGMFASWGLGRTVTEQAPDGSVRFEARFPADTDTYRAFTHPWDPKPAEPPVAVAERSGSSVTAYVSWNGADVDRWELLAGESPDDLEPVASAERTGFETKITGTTDKPYIAVRAPGGQTSAAIQVH